MHINFMSFWTWVIGGLILGFLFWLVTAIPRAIRQRRYDKNNPQKPKYGDYGAKSAGKSGLQQMQDDVEASRKANPAWRRLHQDDKD